MRAIANYIKQTEFIQSANALLKSFPKTLIIVCADILFFLLLLAMANYAETSITILSIANPLAITGIFLMLVLYYLAVVFLYSFLKLIVLNLIKSIVTKVKFSIDKIIKFYLLNLIIAAAILFCILLLSSILANAKEKYSLVLSLILVPFAVLVYVFLNAAHSSFVFNHSIKKGIKAGINNLKNKNVYTGILIPSLVVLIIISVPYYFLYLKANLLIRNAVIYTYEVLLYLIFIISRAGFFILAYNKKYS